MYFTLRRSTLSGLVISLIYPLLGRNTRQVFINVLRHVSWMGFAQPAITCSKSTIETREQGVKYAQS